MPHRELSVEQSGQDRSPIDQVSNMCKYITIEHRVGANTVSAPTPCRVIPGKYFGAESFDIPEALRRFDRALADCSNRGI